ncbi:hypothetical protein LWC34_08770 [Kibdelosporangium philippinense]|uniref:Uncharacterized protein n=1 Tax=Kibdelosporangium philippinense TaxID=211113 RepID=A0ABS8Z4U6_9PSEU|nr:hypothetical protein [Kibdelosporangium philippinense]MCE7002924.1 hypothetical protein [Kibdelosporangium philippinense]
MNTSRGSYFALIRALDLAVRGGQRHTEARIHLGLAAALESLNDHTQAAVHTATALEISREAGFALVRS